MPSSARPLPISPSIATLTISTERKISTISKRSRRQTKNSQKTARKALSLEENAGYMIGLNTISVQSTTQPGDSMTLKKCYASFGLMVRPSLPNCSFSPNGSSTHLAWVSFLTITKNPPVSNSHSKIATSLNSYFMNTETRQALPQTSRTITTRTNLIYAHKRGRDSGLLHKNSGRAKSTLSSD